MNHGVVEPLVSVSARNPVKAGIVNKLNSRAIKAASRGCRVCVEFLLQYLPFGLMQSHWTVNTNRTRPAHTSHSHNYLIARKKTSNWAVWATLLPVIKLSQGAIKRLTLVKSKNSLDSHGTETPKAMSCTRKLTLGEITKCRNYVSSQEARRDQQIAFVPTRNYS